MQGLEMEQITSDQDPSDLYRQLDSYDWENDKEFNSGLNTILTSAPSDQAPRLALRARCYYFARYSCNPHLGSSTHLISHLDQKIWQIR